MTAAPNQSKVSASILPDSPATSPTKTDTASVVKPTTPAPTVETSDVTPPTADTTPTTKSTTPPETKKEEGKKEEIPLERKNAKLYKIGIILFTLILIGTFGVFLMRTKISTITTSTNELKTSPSPSIKTVLSPIPKVKILDRSEITLEILNGTSTSGLAGKIAKDFEELGYEVENIGNANDSEENQLHVKTEFAGQLTNLLSDVKDELKITEITKEVDDLDTTAKIILGKK